MGQNVTIVGGTATAPKIAAVISSTAAASANALAVTLSPNSAAPHTRYMDAALNGRCFVACTQTLATLQTGLTTAQTGLGLYNPTTSGKNLFIWTASCAFTIAQPTASAIYGLCAATNTLQAVPTGQTAATVVNALLGVSTATMTAKPLVAGTLAAAPVAISTLGVAFIGATSVVTATAPFWRDYAGGLIVAPGAYVGFFSSVAAAASSFWGELVWEEVSV